MVPLSLFYLCDGHRFATRRGYFEERSGTRIEEDGSIAIPSPSAPDRSVGEDLRRAARNVDALQFRIRKESYRRAVGRPERVACSVCSRQRLRHKRIQWPDPKLRLA